ncbi:unnamed protein product, partial [Meganyctiphanes norvegica]
QATHSGVNCPTQALVLQLILLAPIWMSASCALKVFTLVRQESLLKLGISNTVRTSQMLMNFLLCFVTCETILGIAMTGKAPEWSSNHSTSLNAKLLSQRSLPPYPIAI